jgi:hypothetical protein
VLGVGPVSVIPLDVFGFVMLVSLATKQWGFHDGELAFPAFLARLSSLVGEGDGLHGFREQAGNLPKVAGQKFGRYGKLIEGDPAVDLSRVIDEEGEVRSGTSIAI